MARVIVFENNQPNAAHWARSLRNFGFQTQLLCANAGAMGEVLRQQTVPSVVIIDLSFGMAAAGLLPRLLARPRSVGGIIVTADRVPTATERSQLTAADYVVLRPILPSGLRGLVDAIVHTIPATPGPIFSP